MKQILVYVRFFEAQCENKEVLWDLMLSFMGRNYYLAHQDELISDCHFREENGVWKAEVTNIWDTELEDRKYQWDDLTKDRYQYIDGEEVQVLFRGL